MDKKFYITTAIDYTNDVVHIGHSYQKVLGDVLARYHRLIGDETYFLTGTDEHGQKVEQSAKEKGVDPKEFVDQIAGEDKKEWDGLNISYDRFIRTTDEDHVKFAQEIYLKSKTNGDIYLDKYEGLYCEGCEAYLVESELVNRKCPFHPNKSPLKISEENYFFRLSKYQKFLEEHIEEHPNFVVPEAKRKEVLAFVKSGLKDFSVSRKNVAWGIPVPDDPKHTIYVWFDALINYLTFGVEKKCWPADIHILGKDNQRFHAIYWPAMLKSVGYDLPKTILVHDFLSLNGQKISKSQGNVVKPSELISKYGADALRYYLLAKFSPFSDGDFSETKLKDAYNGDLANGLGNLISRVAKLCENSGFEFSQTNTFKLDDVVRENLANYRFDEALKNLFDRFVAGLDSSINKEEAWKLEGQALKEFLTGAVSIINNLAYNLKPFLPETADKIAKQFSGPKIYSQKGLFPRI